MPSETNKSDDHETGELMDQEVEVGNVGFLEMRPGKGVTLVASCHINKGF